jgi:hypothetical protein
MRANHFQCRWTRRHFIGALTLAGAGVLLPACGTESAPTRALATSTRPVTSALPPGTSTAAVAASPSPARPAGTSVSTPVGSGTPRPVALGTPDPAVGATELGRFLARLPLVPPLSDEPVIYFADVARQKANYGFAGVSSQQAYTGLSREKRQVFNYATGALPVARIAGQEYAAQSAWRKTLGYDFWQIDRTVEAGDPPKVWARVEGSFDRAEVAAALAKNGHQPVSYGGATILAWGEDGQQELMKELSLLTLGKMNRVVLEDTALSATGYMALAEAGIDVAAGRTPSFAADPDYRALASALGPVVGSVLTNAEYFARSQRSGTPVADRLPPYNRVGLGLRDDGTSHTMVIALVYNSASVARDAGAILLRRLMGHTLARPGGALRDLAVPGDAEFVTSGDRTAVIAPLRINDLEHLNLWWTMFIGGDYPFLAE